MRSVREQEAGIWGLKEERQGCYTGFINKDFYSEVALRHGMRHIQCRLLLSQTWIHSADQL